MAASLLGACATKSEYAGGSSYAASSMGTGNQQQYLINYPGLNPSLPSGMKIWKEQNCAACHGEDGAGVPGKTKVNLAEPVFTYRATPLSQYKKLVYDLPKKNHPDVQKLLSDQQMWDLIFYVRALSHPPLSPKQIEEIYPVFVLNCSGCHNTNGYGDGALAHALDPQPASFHQFNRMFDRQDSMLFNHMHDGLFPSAMPPWAGYKDTKFGITFDDAYLRKLVQYVRHFHVDAGGGIGRWYDEQADARSTMDPDAMRMRHE